jgi:hypothetical protein
MATKPRTPIRTGSLEELVRLLCEQVERMTEEEKAELRYELLKGDEAPPHLRWVN